MLPISGEEPPLREGGCPVAPHLPLGDGRENLPRDSSSGTKSHRKRPGGSGQARSPEPHPEWKEGGLGPSAVSWPTVQVSGHMLSAPKCPPHRASVSEQGLASPGTERPPPRATGQQHGRGSLWSGESRGAAQQSQAVHFFKWNRDFRPKQGSRGRVPDLCVLSAPGLADFSGRARE